MSIMEYNGAVCIAMTGKDCVAIAADRRLGQQAQTIATDFQKIFSIHDHCYVGLMGLATDCMTLSQEFEAKHSMYELEENRRMKPKKFMNLVCTTLYEHRFGPYFIEPVVAGLDFDKEGNCTPYIASADLIGCPMETQDFVIAGTSNASLYGMCESLYKPDLEPEDLFETISQAICATLDRDSISGWGAVVHIITKDEVLTRTLKTRQD